MENKNVEKLIEDSGIITHHKVINTLRDKEWSVLIAPYYYDNIANTIREIDVIAEKQFNSSERAYESSVQINAQLFLECKYVKQQLVFWFDDKDVTGAVTKLERETDLRILHGDRMSADIVSDKFHYLNNNKVAKLFSTNTNKEDVIYKAISQCLNSKIYYDQWSHHPINIEFAKHGKGVTALIKYPVIVCDNFENFFQVNFNDGKYSYEKIKNNFQLEVNYTYLDKTKTEALTETFLIDVVNFNEIDSFITMIENEIKSVVKARSFLL